MNQEEILKIFTKIVEVDINKKSRERNIIEARALYYTICRELLPNITLKELGKTGNKHHATVIHSLKNYPIFEKYNPILKKQKQKILNILNEKLEPLNEENYIDKTSEYKIKLSLLNEENNNLKNRIKFLEVRNKIKILRDLEDLILNLGEKQKEVILEKLNAFYSINKKVIYN